MVPNALGLGWELGACVLGPWGWGWVGGGVGRGTLRTVLKEEMGPDFRKPSTLGRLEPGRVLGRGFRRGLGAGGVAKGEPVLHGWGPP